jgi:hypothetical protein
LPVLCRTVGKCRRCAKLSPQVLRSYPRPNLTGILGPRVKLDSGHSGCGSLVWGTYNELP